MTQDIIDTIANLLREHDEKPFGTVGEIIASKLTSLGWTSRPTEREATSEPFVKDVQRILDEHSACKGHTMSDDLVRRLEDAAHEADLSCDFSTLGKLHRETADRIRDLETQLKQSNDAAFNEGIEAASNLMKTSAEKSFNPKAKRQSAAFTAMDWCWHQISQLKRT
jgi:hypothetical protein